MVEVRKNESVYVSFSAFVLDREMKIRYDDIQKTEYVQLQKSSADEVR
jgi:hypothetical protein